MLLDLLKKADCNAKNTDTEGKVPSITGSATTAALNAVEKKIPKLVIWSKKQIMIKKSQTSRLNILPRLIMINLWIRYLMPS